MPQGANQLPNHPNNQRTRSKDRNTQGKVRGWTNFQFHHTTPRYAYCKSALYTLVKELLTIKARGFQAWNFGRPPSFMNTKVGRGRWLLKWCSMC